MEEAKTSSHHDRPHHGLRSYINNFARPELHAEEIIIEGQRGEEIKGMGHENLGQRRGIGGHPSSLELSPSSSVEEQST